MRRARLVLTASALPTAADAVSSSTSFTRWRSLQRGGDMLRAGGHDAHLTRERLLAPVQAEALAIFDL
jgi:hypothetical protein